MNHTIFLGIILALSSGYLLPSSVHAGDQPRPIKVLLIDGYSNHDWQRTTRLACGILENTGLFEVSVATAPATTNDPTYTSWAPAFWNYDVVIQTCNDQGNRGPLWRAPVRNAFE